MNVGLQQICRRRDWDQLRLQIWEKPSTDRKGTKEMRRLRGGWRSGLKGGEWEWGIGKVSVEKARPEEMKKKMTNTKKRKKP